MNEAPSTFPYKTAAKQASSGDIGLRVFGRMSVFTVLAQIGQLERGFAGRIRCQLALSFGELTVHGNRDSVPLTLKQGDWVRVNVFRVPAGAEPRFVVLRMQPERPHSTTSWVPEAWYHRRAHMQRLLWLLEQLEPSMQAAFYVAMRNEKLQHKFFWRVAATDHHCYPGGLFDQSIRAGELAFAMSYETPRKRSIATIAALLFDLGKAGDPLVCGDLLRTCSGLEPHAQTTNLLKSTFSVMSRVDPDANAELMSLLDGATSDTAAEGHEADFLRQAVLEAVSRSWRMS